MCADPYLYFLDISKGGKNFGATRGQLVSASSALLARNLVARQGGKSALVDDTCELDMLRATFHNSGKVAV
jgi:hypothetical protein